ncbi:erythromycin esterase family protein [Rufibacter ruber]|uniref:erythromycin esterase family protein n=1 Tax=Rufibacter ruber TaxID=1783499 RepID=UPI00082C72C3|nr:erythromycin esterase family protein [Rufibacter ruber]
MKKTLKRIALFLLLTPLVLLLLGVIAYGIYALTAVGGESTPHQTYLQQHQQEVTFTEDTPFPLFDSAFYQKQIILLGESHGTATPQELDFALLKHLNQKVGLRHYLAEVDYSQAALLNQYLQTGNEERLRFVFQFWARHNAQWGNQEFYNKIKKIRALNQTLPPHRQIWFLGVDRIQDTDALHRHLRELITQLPAKPEDTTTARLKQMAAADTLDTDALVRTAAQFLSSRAQDTANFDLRHTLQNVVYLQDKIKRDSVMYLNLQTLVQQKGLEREKLYGMWGIFHTIPVRVQRGVPFAYLLQGDTSPFKGKAVSIGVYTVESESMMPAAALPAAINKGQRYVNTTWANQDGPLVFVNGIKDLKAVSRGHVSLFKTDAAHSPYRTSPRLASFKTLFPGQSIEFAGANPRVATIFPYICLVKNSKALTPVKW